MSGRDRLIGKWTDHPYTGIGKRHISVEHRIRAEQVGVGVDIYHEIRCEERGEPDWKSIEVWEFRQHGVDKRSAGDWKAIPDGGFTEAIEDGGSDA